MTRWYRAYEGTVTDAKIGEAALVADCSRSVAIACWHCILESCATAQAGGEYDTTPRRVAVILGEQPATIERVFAAFAELDMIADGAVTAWKDRQFESDTSTERSRKHRQRKRNADATLQQRDATVPETETDTELEQTSVTREASQALEASLREAAGWQQEPAPGLFVTGPIEALIANGADLERDVLPVIRGLAPRVRRPSTWNYFVGAIQDAVASRKAALTSPAPFKPSPERMPHASRNTIAGGFEIIDRAIEQRERELAAAQGGEGRGEGDLVEVPRLRQGAA